MNTAEPSSSTTPSVGSQRISSPLLYILPSITTHGEAGHRQDEMQRQNIIDSLVNIKTLKHHKLGAKRIESMDRYRSKIEVSFITQKCTYCGEPLNGIESIKHHMRIHNQMEKK